MADAERPETLGTNVPFPPMEAELVSELPAAAGAWRYEPKWDGFRAIAFRDEGTVYIQSRDLKPLDRYFPEVHDALVRGLPEGAVVDGEVVIATPAGLDFDALQMRLHPAASRVEKLVSALLVSPIIIPSSLIQVHRICMRLKTI